MGTWYPSAFQSPEDGLTQHRLRQLGTVAALAFTLGAGALILPTHPSAAQGSGVYSSAQAQRGAKLFADDCAMCHGSDLSGGAGPPLSGKPFIGKWTGQTADDLHDVVATQMPLTAPGSLKPDEYLALVAFILSKNGYPAGSTALEKSKLKTITIKAQ
jgi:mono/diheme cytochrome c family protein